MLIDLSPSQVRALTGILLDTITRPGHTDVHIDVVAQVETTPEELLILFMDLIERPVTVATLRAAMQELRTAQVAHARAVVAAGAAHECAEWDKDGWCQLCGRDATS